MPKLTSRGKRAASKSGRRFLVEPLESRTLLTTLPVLMVNGTSGNDSISLSNSGVFQFQVNLNSTITKYIYTSYSGIQINGVGGNDTINIMAIGLPTTVVGAGQDTVTLGDSNGVQDITAPVTITDPPSYAALTVDDSGDLTKRNATISDTSITNLGPATINYHPGDLSSLTINGSTGGNTFTVANTPHGLGTTPTTLNSGEASDVYTIQGTASASVLTIEGGFGADTVNITDAGSTQNIDGAINILSAQGFDTLTIDDSADTTARTVNFDGFLYGSNLWQSVTGLAPAEIAYEAVTIHSVTFDGGNGGNTFNVAGIAAESAEGGNAPLMTFNTGNGNDVINIGPAFPAATILTLNGQGGSDTINLDFSSGNPLPNAVNLNGLFTITGFTVGENLNNTTLNLNRSTVYINYGGLFNDPLALIEGYLKTGYNNGTWTGTATTSTGAINSSPAAANPNHTTAIGYADWADGKGVDTVPNTIELTYTLYGDANLDHQVNSADLQILLFSLNKPGVWDQGDFNYDAQVNSADLQNLLFTLNTGLGNQVVAAGLQASSSTPASPPPSKPLPDITTYVATGGPVLPPPPSHNRHHHG